MLKYVHKLRLQQEIRNIQLKMELNQNEYIE